MPEQPLQPFAPPTALVSHIPFSISQSLVAQVVFYIVFAFWAVYTLVAIYHWFKYSHASVIAIPAIVMHLGISFILIVYIFSGILFL